MLVVKLVTANRASHRYVYPITDTPFMEHMFLRTWQDYYILPQLKILQTNVARPIRLFYHISRCRHSFRQSVFILSWIHPTATAVEA